jgi:hypothetical protein
MRELERERVISRVGLEGKGAVKEAFANCPTDSSGDFSGRLPKYSFKRKRRKDSSLEWPLGSPWQQGQANRKWAQDR